MTESPTSTTTPGRSSMLLWLVSCASLATAIVAVVIAVRTVERASHEIVVTDSKGRPRVRLTARLDGGQIELLDDRGAPRLALAQNADDRVTLSMRRKDDENRWRAMTLEVTASNSRLALNSDLDDGDYSSVWLDTAAGATVGTSWGPIRKAFLSAEKERIGLNVRADLKNWFQFEINKLGLYLSGEGPSNLSHGGLEQEIAWHARHKRLDPDLYPESPACEALTTACGVKK